MRWKLDTTPAPVRVNEKFDRSIGAREITGKLYELSMTGADTIVIANKS